MRNHCKLHPEQKLSKFLSCNLKFQEVNLSSSKGSTRLRERKWVTNRLAKREVEISLEREDTCEVECIVYLELVVRKAMIKVKDAIGVLDHRILKFPIFLGF